MCDLLERVWNPNEPVLLISQPISKDDLGTLELAVIAKINGLLLGLTGHTDFPVYYLSICARDLDLYCGRQCYGCVRDSEVVVYFVGKHIKVETIYDSPVLWLYITRTLDSIEQADLIKKTEEIIKTYG